MNQEDIIKSNMIKIPDLMNLLHSSYSIMKNVELNIYFKNDKDRHRFKFYNINFTCIKLENYEEKTIVRTFIIHDAGLCCFVDALKITWSDESSQFEYIDNTNNRENYWNMLSEEMNWVEFRDGLKFALVSLI